MRWLLSLIIWLLPAWAQFAPPGGGSTCGNPNCAVSGNMTVSGTATVGATATVLPNIIFSAEGDSITAPVSQGGPPGSLNWPYQLGSLGSPISSTTVYNWAAGSDTCANMVGEYATQAHTVRPTKTNDVGYFGLLCGVNDIAAATPTATIYKYLKNIWAAARFDGYAVIAFTLDGTGGNALNTLIISDPTQYDYLVRNDLVLPNTSDPLLFLPGGVHPNPAGSLLTAKAVAVALNQSPTQLSAEKVVNPGYEYLGSGPGGSPWYGWTSGATNTTAAGTVHSGVNAAQLTSVTSYDQLVLEEPEAGALTVGSTYALSFWTRGDGVHSCVYTIYDQGNAAYIVPNNTSTGVTGTTYQYVEVSFVATAGMSATFFSISSPASAGTCYVDDVSWRVLVSAPNSTPVFSGLTGDATSSATGANTVVAGGNHFKGAVAVNSFVGTVTSSGTTVTFSRVPDSVSAGYSATSPIVGTTIIAAGQTAHVVSWTDSQHAVVDVAPSPVWSTAAITSTQLPILATANSAGNRATATYANGDEVVLGKITPGACTFATLPTALGAKCYCTDCDAPTVLGTANVCTHAIGAGAIATGYAGASYCSVN